MRRRINKEYLRKGQLLKRIYEDDGSYETIATTFRYQSQGQTTQSGGQLMSGFMHTDTTSVVKAITDLRYEKGDKVILDNKQTYEITQVVNEGLNEYGRLRGFKRSAKILYLT
jgi:hypothetical protein